MSLVCFSGSASACDFESAQKKEQANKSDIQYTNKFLSFKQVSNMIFSGLLSNGLLYAVLYILAVIVGFTIHEFSHAWVGTKLGDPTAKLEGRLTLNPLSHLDPLGTIFLFFVGFGWGKPVPYNPRYFKNKNDEIKVALAGITSNLLMVIVISIPIRLAMSQGIDLFASPFYYFCIMLFWINIILAVFNLLPIPPLDGSHVVDHYLSEESKVYYAAYGPYLLILFLLIDQFSSTSILLQIMDPVIRFIGGSQIHTLFFH